MRHERTWRGSEVLSLPWQVLLWAPTSTRMRILDGLKERGAAFDFDGVLELLDEAARYKDVTDLNVVKWMRDHDKIKELKKAYSFLADVQVRLMSCERAFVCERGVEVHSPCVCDEVVMHR